MKRINLNLINNEKFPLINWISKNPAISPMAKCLYIVLISNENHYKINLSSLQGWLGKSTRYIMQYLKYLKENEIVEVTKTEIIFQPLEKFKNRDWKVKEKPIVEPAEPEIEKTEEPTEIKIEPVKEVDVQPQKPRKTMRRKKGS